MRLRIILTLLLLLAVAPASAQDTSTDEPPQAGGGDAAAAEEASKEGQGDAADPSAGDEGAAQEGEDATTAADAEQPDDESDPKSGADVAPDAPSEEAVTSDNADIGPRTTSDGAGYDDASSSRPDEPVQPEDVEGASWAELASRARFSINTYGVIVTNAVLNTGAVAPTLEAPIGAKRGSLLDDELPGQGSFLITARQSRVGVKANAQWAEDARVEARLELDLWGIHETEGPGTITQTSLRLRSAYMRLSDGGLHFLAGQNWVVITPRVPKAYGHMAVALHSESGAVWNRLPQLTLELNSDFGAGLQGKAFFSVVRPHSGDGERGITRFDTQAPGPQSSLPWLQSRLALRHAHFEFGVAGHFGYERFEVAVGTETEPGYRYGELRMKDVDVMTWLVSTDAHLEVGDFWFNGQLWMGQNLNGMFSHHGVLTDTWDQDDVFAEAALVGQLRDVTPLQAYGGWGELGLNFGDSGWSALTSVGVETGPRSDVDYGKRYRNIGLFGALMWSPLSFMDVSVEYLRSMTFYRPDLENREDPAFRNDEDLLGGDEPPARESMGFNDSFSLNFRLRF